MKKFKLFIVDDERGDGGTMIVDNDTVMSSAQRRPLPDNPDGWNDMSIGWERNTTNYGIVRNFSLALNFVKDGAKILRNAFYNETIERKISLLITMLSLKFTDSTFAYQYRFLYKGDLDGSTIIDQPNKVSVNVMENGVSALVAANQATDYPIPLDDPDAISLYCDGIKLFQKINYDISTGTDGSALVLGFENNKVVGVVVESQDGQSTGIVSIESAAEEFTGSAADYIASSNNYFLDNQVSVPTDVVIAGIISFKVQTVIAAPHITIYLKSSAGYTQNIVDHVLLTANGVTRQQFSYSHTLAPNEELYLLAAYDVSDNIISEAVIAYLDDSAFSVSFSTRFRPTIVKVFTLYDFYRKLVGKITGDPEDAISTLLSTNKNICITCGDAIRGFVDAQIKTKLTDLFTAANVQFNAGLGVESNQLSLEAKAHYFDNSNPIPLGEVKARPKIYVAKDLMANTFRIGSEPQDYTDINGRDEFNNSTIFGSSLTRVVAQFDLVSPYRRDCYGFEYTRINFDGKTTTDTDNDNDVWLVNVATNVASATAELYTGPFETLAPNYVRLPGSIDILDFQITISGSAFSDGLYPITNVSYLEVGFTRLTVVGTLAAHSDSGVISIGGVRPYALKRGTYDNITGLLSPDTVFNIEDMTVQRLIRHHGNWIRSMMYGFDNSFLTFQITDKNALLSTTKDGVTFQENANVRIGDLDAPLFIPKYMEIEMKIPVNLPSLLDNNPAKCFSFTWEGNIYEGFLIKAGISISDNATQVFKLLATPNNDFKKLV